MSNISPFPAQGVENDTLGRLAASWLETKNAEAAANEKRLQIENEILKHLPIKDEGTVSDCAGGYKVTVTYKLNRDLDAAQLSDAAIWGSLTDVERAAVAWKPALVLKQLRAIEAAAPDIYARFCGFLITKRAKPSIKVEGK